MGAVLSFQATSEQEKFLNNITQANKQDCVVRTNNSNSGQVIIATGGTLNNVNLGQTITVNTDATCLIGSGVQGDIDNLLKATSAQGAVAETGPFATWGTISESVSLASVRQNTVNNIYQVSQATCGTDQINSNSSQYIYLADDVNGGFIGQSIDSNVNSSCTMNNYMKFSTYNLAQAQAGQKTEHKGTLGGVGVIVLVVAILVVLLGAGAFFVSSKKKKAEACTPDPTTGKVSDKCKTPPPGAAPVKPGTMPAKPGTMPVNPGTMPVKPGTMPAKTGGMSSIVSALEAEIRAKGKQS